MLLPPRRTAGFTLIELMIVVAIVGILSAVAYPSYQNYIRKSRRADAHALLQGAQIAQEKWRISNTTYTGTVTNLAGVCYTSPCDSTDKHYRLSISGNSGTGYILSAQPQGNQTKDTACPFICIQQSTTGIVYGNAPNNTSCTASNICWNK